MKTILIQAGKMKLRSINVPTEDKMSMDRALNALDDYLKNLSRHKHEMKIKTAAEEGSAFLKR